MGRRIIVGLVDSSSPAWSMYVPVSADLINILGPREAQPDPEHDLFESMLVEATDIYGIEVDYYPLNINYFDSVYGENQNVKYYGPFTTKVLYRPGDEPSLFQIWGMISDEIIDAMVIPQYSFWRDVSLSPNGPAVGDIIRAKWNRSQAVTGVTDIFYEVTGVGDEANTFLALKFSYEIKVRPMRAGENENIIARDAVDILTGGTDALPLSAGGDNIILDVEHEKIDSYDDLPTIDDIYGYK